MGKTYRPSSDPLPIVFSIGLAICICAAILFAGSPAKAGAVDKIAKLIADSKEAPTEDQTAEKKTGKPPAKSENKTKKTDTKQSASLPPVPDRNPLRNSKKKRAFTGHTLTNTFPSPTQTKNGSISNSVQALTPVLHYKVSSRDITALKKSIDHVLRNSLGDARAARSKISDPVVRKLALWYYLRKASDISDPMKMERFGNDNEDWPSGRLLHRRTERALLKKKASPKVIKALYSEKPPSTGVGKYLLALAHKRSGQPQKALKLARSAWHTHSLGQKNEKELIKNFGAELTKSDHRRRADHFLYKDKRRLLPTVRRVRKHLAKADQDKINLRMEVIKRRLNDANKQYDKMGKKAHADVGLLFNKIQMLRRKEKFDLSRKLLDKAPIDAKKMVEPDEWWIERRLQTRYALRHKKPLEAYKIASRHGEISRKHLGEAEFLAGWIALTRLDKIEAAAGHFAIQRKNAESRAEIAKAEYWLGRLKLKQKDSIGALAHFAASAKHFRTYYGQLALQSIEDPGHIGKTDSPPPSQEELKRFVARDAVLALVIAHKAQLRSLVPLFFNRLAWHLKSPGEMTLLAELASQIHSRRGSVITGKIGVYRGFELDRYAYPVNAMPHFDRLTAKVDTALVLALARQESEFNAKAKSPVGARGMMQIMPGTARAIARQHKVRYSRSRLVSDPSYNIALGVAHLHDLIKKYNGSYILPLVAYNAGPRRVREWIESFGDPRKSSVDTIDWIESIPFTETRRYVQRIMSSVQIFRSRLQEGTGRITLVEDINRGHPTKTASAENPPLVKVNLTNP
jgi:peptidoglycan lytic transglycosylase